MEFETTTLIAAKILMTKKAHIFLVIISPVNIFQSGKNIVELRQFPKN